MGIRFSYLSQGGRQETWSIVCVERRTTVPYLVSIEKRRGKRETEAIGGRCWGDTHTHTVHTNEPGSEGTYYYLLFYRV